VNPDPSRELLDELFPAPGEQLAPMLAAVRHEKRRRRQRRQAGAALAILALAGGMLAWPTKPAPPPATAAPPTPHAESPATESPAIPHLSDEELLDELAKLGHPAALVTRPDGSRQLVMLDP